MLFNAGVILFAKPEIREQLFPSAYVSCARSAGAEKVDFLDQLDIGRVIEAFDKVPVFIRRNTRLSSVIKDIRRKDIPEYPTVAVREGLLNALMHADYTYTGMRIFVSIFDDRLEIRSPGCLPPGMTLDGLKEGISIPRNLVIARIFHMLGWVEQFGTGYFRIKQACDKEGYPLPEWREVGPYTDIVFEPIKMERVYEVSHGTKSGLSEEELKILTLCTTALPFNNLMTTIGWKNRTKFRQRFIVPLLEQRLLTMTIPDKPNSRLQKYLITDEGLKILKLP